MSQTTAEGQQAAKLLPSVLIIVKSIDTVGNFIQRVFECAARELVEFPCTYSRLTISDQAHVVMVQSGSCDEEMMTALGTCAVRQLFITAKNPALLQKRYHFCILSMSFVNSLRFWLKFQSNRAWRAGE